MMTPSATALADLLELLARMLHARGYHDILFFDANTPMEFLERYCADCGFVYHLAGVNRPKEQEEFMQGNFGFTDALLRLLIKYKNRCPVMFASSTQAALPNLYGRSKKPGEELLDQYDGSQRGRDRNGLYSVRHSGRLPARRAG